LAIATMLVFWIAAGLYNPLLFHPVAGVNYAVLAALAALTPSRSSCTLCHASPGV